MKFLCSACSVLSAMGAGAVFTRLCDQLILGYDWGITWTDVAIAILLMISAVAGVYGRPYLIFEEGEEDE